MVTPPSWPVGRLWHGSSTDWVSCLNCDGSKQAKTERGRVEGAPAKRGASKTLTLADAPAVEAA